MSKLGIIPILTFAICVAICILSWSYFWFYQPNVEDAKNQEQQALDLHKQAGTIKQADKRLKDAVAMVNEKSAEWDKIAAVHTVPGSLNAGGINMGVNAWQMTVDVRTFHNSIQKAVNAQAKVGGVKVINMNAIPFPSDSAGQVVADYFNYPAIPFPVVIFDLGQVTVRGTYSQIKANVKAWSQMPNYLAVADGLSFTGTAPILTATYNLTIVGYIRSKTVSPSVPENAPAAGGAGNQGGGAPGGRSFGGGGSPPSGMPPGVPGGMNR